MDTQRGTTFEKDGVKLKTVEHVLAALVGLEIDNVHIEINGEETTNYGWFFKVFC